MGGLPATNPKTFLQVPSQCVPIKALSRTLTPISARNVPVLEVQGWSGNALRMLLAAVQKRALRNPPHWRRPPAVAGDEFDGSSFRRAFRAHPGRPS